MSEPRNRPLPIGPARTTVRVAAPDADQRLDRYLRKLVPGAPASFLFKAIDRGRIRLNGAKVAPGTRVRAGDEIALPIGRAEMARLARRAAPPRPGTGSGASVLRVVHEDDAILAADKPAGQTTHGGAGSLTDAVLRRIGPSCTAALTFRLAPAHRLDKDTSGVIVFGKTPAAQRALAAAFRERAVAKHYAALVLGKTPAAAELTSCLVRRNRPRGPKMIEGAGGAAAETRYRRLATSGRVSLVELCPGTGRTHQLRAQLAGLGHPILGDRRYASDTARALARELGLDRLFLHALRLVLPHPAHGLRLVLRAELPPALRRVLARLELPCPRA
ncbi:MAG: RluA family pseudouridine synthase [Planctomycetes bacterium]|nr:RluA family pseudouridine synthase [Planctomycetota bacterium]